AEVHVALIELAEASARWPVGAPDGLNLVAFEKLRQLVAVLRDDARERHGQIVSQREVGFAGLLVFAALEDFEDELIALFAVFAKQRLDVLDRRRLQRLETLTLVHFAHDA